MALHPMSHPGHQVTRELCCSEMEEWEEELEGCRAVSSLHYDWRWSQQEAEEVVVVEQCLDDWKPAWGRADASRRLLGWAEHWVFPQRYSRYWVSCRYLELLEVVADRQMAMDLTEATPVDMWKAWDLLRYLTAPALV